MNPFTDLARLMVALTLLGFASYTDWRWRRAPNVLWLAMAAAGAALLVVDAALDFAALRDAWPYLAAAPVVAGVVYLLYQTHLIAGGADAKALMALAVLAPFPFALGALPLSRSPLPVSVVVLENSLVVALAVPLVTFAVNVARGDFGWFAFVGYRKRVDDLAKGHAWPMEWVDDEGRLRRVLFASRHEHDVEEQVERLKKLGVEKVWVTPKVPFMIPLAIGTVLAFTAGDIILAGMRAVLGG